jgi:hypothetical protein
VEARAAQWAGPGSEAFVAVANLTYTLALWVQIRGDQVRCNDGSLLAPHVTLNLSDGRPVSVATNPSVATGAFVIEPLLTVGDVRITPAFPTIGENVPLRADVTGGVPPLTYVWRGLPPGCESTNSDTISCTAHTSGEWGSGVTVSDAQGLLDQNYSRLTVSVQPTSPIAGTATPSGSDWTLPLVLAISSAGLLAAGAWTLRRRRSD